MKNLSIMIKPASSLCNMRCKYCFYADVSNNRSIKSCGIMTEVERIKEAGLPWDFNEFCKTRHIITGDYYADKHENN